MGGSLSLRNNEPSIYWQLINRRHFRQPICEVRIPHLKDIKFFKLLRDSLPSRLLDFWMLLANYGIHNRSRLGHTDDTRQCHLCDEVETPAHLFTNCSRLSVLFDIFNDRLQLVCGRKINKSFMSTVYLQEINQLPSDRSIRGNMVYLVGCYLHAIWTYRNTARHQRNRRQNMDCSIAVQLFLADTKRFPFDNG